MYSKDTVHNTSKYTQQYTRIYVIRNYHILIRNYSAPRGGRGEVGPTRGITVIAAPGAAAAAVMPGVRSTPGLPRGGDARGAARAAATGSIFGCGRRSAKPHLYGAMPRKCRSGLTSLKGIRVKE